MVRSLVTNLQILYPDLPLCGRLVGHFSKLLKKKNGSSLLSATIYCVERFISDCNLYKYN